jgi:hypothetical protein
VAYCQEAEVDALVVLVLLPQSPDHMRDHDPRQRRWVTLTPPLGKFRAGVHVGRVGVVVGESHEGGEIVCLLVDVLCFYITCTSLPV